MRHVHDDWKVFRLRNSKWVLSLIMNLIIEYSTEVRQKSDAVKTFKLRSGLSLLTMMMQCTCISAAVLFCNLTPSLCCLQHTTNIHVNREEAQAGYRWGGGGERQHGQVWRTFPSCVKITRVSTCVQVEFCEEACASFYPCGKLLIYVRFCLETLVWLTIRAE